VADYPRRHRRGVLVRRVDPDGAANGALFSGDLIVAADGAAVETPTDLARAVAAAAGRAIRFTIRVEGRARTVGVEPRAPSGEGPPSLGVEVMPNFPFDVVIGSGDIGGPSAGLMWAVGVIDLLTRGDLTGGRRIAGSGTIDLDGTVGPVGGIELKVLAAERAGAEAFLVPRGDLAAAGRVVTTMRLVPIDDLDDALRYLASTCGCPPV
jgi:PDZ domain-containing protein